MKRGEVVKTYSVPIPAALDEAASKRMAAGGFNSIAEYVRSAIRADLDVFGQATLTKASVGRRGARRASGG